MPDMEPITREEALMNGDYIEPITREEMILAGEDIEPITRREWFLKKYRGDGDVEVVTLHANENTTYVAPEGQAYSPVVVEVPVPTLTTLEVDENGTYTAPTGTAYNEVEVDVPLPENAYLLKDIPNTPTAIATFSDGANLPMPKLEVGIEPVQDLHGYDNPWPAGGGKNKLRVTAKTQTVNGITYTVNDDGTITANGTANDDSRFDFGIYIAKAQSQQIMNGLPNSVTDDSIDMGYQGYGVINKTTRELVINRDADKDWNNDTYILIKNGTTVNNLVFYPMIRLATETNATFAPYSNICPISGWSEANVTVADDVETPTVSNVYTIDLNGTRYGGKVDLVSGVMVLTHGFADLGTVNWDKYTSSTKTYFRTSAQLPDAKKSDSPSTTHNLMCSDYKEDTWSHVIDGSGYDGNICIGWNNNAYIGIYDSRYADTSVSDFKTAMSGVQLVYELATPLTIQLSPTPVISFDGVNNVSADSGDVLDGKYFSKEE